MNAAHAGLTTQILSLARSRLLRGTATYALAAALPRGIALLMLPIYTRVLTPAEYGQVAIIATLAAAIQGLASFGLETAVFREFVRIGPDIRRRAVLANTVAVFALVGTTLVAVTSGVLLAVFAASPLGVEAPAIVLGCIAAGMQAAALILPLARLRADDNLRGYVVLTTSSALGSATLLFSAVVVLQLGVVGWYGAAALGAGLLVTLAFAGMGQRWHLKFDRVVMAGLLAFSLPLIPHFFAHWGLSLSDRLLLGAYLSADVVGVYGLAQQFALPVSVIVVAIGQALMPRYASASQTSTREQLKPVLTNQAVLVGLVSFATAIIAPAAILVLAPSSYAQAADLVGWVVLGYLFFGLYLGPMNVISLTIGQTRWVWIVTGMAALVNVGLNVLLIPAVGVIAAAVNTAIGYALLAGLMHLYIRVASGRGLAYDWAHLVTAGLLMAGAYAATELLVGNEHPVPALIVRVLIVALVAATLGAHGLRRLRDNPDINPSGWP